MAPAWEQLAEEWKGHKVGLVAEVDCTVDEDLCQEYGVEGFPSLMYGDPLAPDQYVGGRDYESLSAFAKENISEAVCSVHNVEVCTKDEKKAIEELKKKTMEQLETIDLEVQEGIEGAQAEFDAEVDKINEMYETLAESYNEKVDKLREGTNHRFVQQLLQKMYSDEEGSDEL